MPSGVKREREGGEREMRWSADGSSGFARADRSRIGDEERRGEKPSVVSCNVTVNFGRARGVGSCGSRGVDRERERERGVMRRQPTKEVAAGPEG